MHTLGQLAELVDGQTEGDGSVKISGVRPFEDARPGDITLAAAPRYWNNLKETRATAVIAPPELQSASLPLLRTADPMLAFARVISLFYTSPFQTRGISSQAEIGKDCRIAERVSIHPFVSIGEGVTIEEEVTLHSGVSVGDGCYQNTT
jgi:UDP-3-O-[3-hydroxymyristoyl] glucosamine N-acyltransferase